MTEESFQKAYSNLNTEQKRAVDSIEGPVMVIAGPGTGKTSVLTLRIANILKKTDTPPNGILALTFTESAVHSMRRKLFDYIGPSAYRVNLHTFHGFAQEIITRYPEYFPRIIGGVIATDSERFEILEQALKEGNFEIIRPFGDPFFYVRKALSVIQDIKRDGIDSTSFKKIVTNEEKDILAQTDLYHEKGRSKGLMKRSYVDALKNNKKNQELANLYSLYEDSLKKRSLYDYDDLLLELVSALRKDEELKLTLQEEYLYILADEHQDANNSQNAILELLSDYRDTRNLFIVGDEKQAIYRFQGASLENFLYFQKKFNDAEVVFLDHNYRSSQTILDTSHALMEGGDTPLPRPRLKRGTKEGVDERPVMLTKFLNQKDELLGVAQSVLEHIESGVRPEDIAILVRTNKEIESIGRALSGFSVPHTLFTDDDVLSDPDISKFLILLRAIVYPDNDLYVGSMFLIDFLGLNPIDAISLNRMAFEIRKTPLQVLNDAHVHQDLSMPESVARLSHLFLNWIKIAHNESAVDAFLKIIDESNFQEHLLNRRGSLEKIEKLTKLYDEIKIFLSTHKDAKLIDFIDSIDTLIRHGTPISFSRKSLGFHGVSVMTAHKSKGLEWHSVFVPNAVDMVWGNRRRVAGFRLPHPLGSNDESSDNDDERRLFYVALTRAKQYVAISYASIDDLGREKLVSQFVTELPENFLIQKEGKVFSSSEELKRALTQQKSEEKTLWDKEYLKNLFEEQGLNPTALNNYLRCPWNYFFKNLIRLPDIPEKYLHFGNAIHAGLKMYADQRREGHDPDPQEVFSVFERFLARMPLSVKDLADSAKKGALVIPQYIERYHREWHKETITEFSITGVSLPLVSGREVLLRGRIDKIELLNDGTVNVVDYKTGSRKTRNEILGKTKNSNGDMKRQLDFYKLLLDLHDNGKFPMVSGDIDFVEPDKNGKFYKEHFEITSQDKDELVDVIVNVAEEISNFSFWSSVCDDPQCRFCNLKKTLIG